MRTRSKSALLFLLLSVVYHSNLRPIAGSDSLPAALIPFSVWLDGSVALDRFAPDLNERVPYAASVIRQSGGHWYSTYPIAGPLLASPLYAPLAIVPGIRRQSPDTLIALARIAEKVAAVVLAAGAAVLLLLLLRRLTTDGAAWWLTLLFALGTNQWATSSQALWQHSFDQLAIIGLLLAIERQRPFQGGACAAIAIAMRPTNVVLLPALAVALWLRRSRPADYLRALAPIGIAGVVVVGYNLAVFHWPTGGYSGDIRIPTIHSLAGVLLSPGRGLLIYTPVAAFALAALAPAARDALRKRRPIAAAAGVIAVLQILLIAGWPIWWGGYCWGPRLLSESLAPIVVLIAIGLPALASRRWKTLFAAAAVYGCFIQALGAYCWPKGRWDALPASVDTRPERLWNWADNPIVRTARGGLAWEPYAVAAAGVRGGPAAAAAKLRELGINSF